MKKEAKKTLIRLVIAVPLMFAFGFALVPLYDVFCEVTGINGKVFQSEHSEELVTEDGRQIALQFISTNNENMPWTFKPSEQVLSIQTGKYHTATFYVKNTTFYVKIAKQTILFFLNKSRKNRKMHKIGQKKLEPAIIPTYFCFNFFLGGGDLGPIF